MGRCVEVAGKASLDLGGIGQFLVKDYYNSFIFNPDFYIKAKEQVSGFLKHIHRTLPRIGSKSKQAKCIKFNGEIGLRGRPDPYSSYIYQVGDESDFADLMKDSII